MVSNGIYQFPLGCTNLFVIYLFIKKQEITENGTGSN